MKNRTKGLIGETAVTLELLKLGYDVFNLNGIYHNYKNADLECINPENMKTTMIQVKTGTANLKMRKLISSWAKSLRKRLRLLFLDFTEHILMELSRPSQEAAQI